MMKAWIRGTLSLGLATLFVTSCVLVENFQGYEPLGTGGECDEPPCDYASSSSSGANGGMGVGGTSGSASSSSTGAGGAGGNPTCVKIPCNGSPCMPEVIVPDAQAGLVAVDSQSLFIKTAAPSHVLRVAKPGCQVPNFDQPIGLVFGFQDFVSDGQFVAWLDNDLQNPCTTPSLKFCDVANCQPQELLVSQIFPDQGYFGRLVLGPGYLYFTMRNGLVARLAKGSTAPEQLWYDPANQSGPMKRGLLGYPAIVNNKLFVERSFIEDAGMDVCSGSPVVNTGTIWTSDTTPGAVPQPVVQNLYYPGPFAVSQNYVYYTIFDSTKLLVRAPLSGGTPEAMDVNAKFSAASIFQSIFIVKGWVYFRFGLPNSGQGIGRFPAETANFTADAIEILVEGLNLVSFYVDDDAMYWTDCTDASCTAYQVLARVVTP